MKRKFTFILFASLCLLNRSSYALENDTIKVAKVFSHTIYVSNLEPNFNSLDRYGNTYPDLSDDAILVKMREDKLSVLIWQEIIQKLSKEYNLLPTNKEIEEFNNAINHHRPSTSLREQTPEINQALREMNSDFVKTYKVSKFLYETYGGEVIFQQANPQEPIGAYRQLLEEYEEQGLLIFYQQTYKKAFWRYYLMDHPMVIPPDKVDFSSPWWAKMKQSD